MTNSSSPAESWGTRIGRHAADHPDEIALVHVTSDGTEHSTTWRELEGASNAFARLLQAKGAGAGSTVAIALPNCTAHIIAALATWKIGGCAMPLSVRAPAVERAALVELADPSVVVGATGAPGQEHWDVDITDVLGAVDAFDNAPLPDLVSCPGKAIASGGSTGRPKLILDPRPWVRVPGDPAIVGADALGMRPGQVQLVAGPLYHNGPFCWTHFGLFEGHRIVLMEKFSAALAVELISRHRVEWAFMVPTMLKRIADLPAIAEADFSSLEVLWHSAGPCPPHLKRTWVELLGGSRLREAYGSTEGAGVTVLTGDEWLERPGSVGRPHDCEVRILNDGVEAAAGEIGEIYMRPTAGVGPTYQYVGAPPPPTTPDGFVSAGDLGWLDADGWLYLADRRSDMIVTGGANVYPAEVEGVLQACPGVQDVAVIGLPDDEWGMRVHAVVQPVEGTRPTARDLDAHCRGYLQSYKVPKTYELVDALPRDEAGKIRRSALREERA